MLAKRIIPCLDVQNGMVVKGVNFEGIKEVGDPVECAVAYDRQGADEILAVLHFPPTNDMHQNSEFTKLLESYGVKKCIYGHLHGKDNFRRGLQGVKNGVEYSLVSLDYLQAKPKEVYK